MIVPANLDGMEVERSFYLPQPSPMETEQQPTLQPEPENHTAADRAVPPLVDKCDVAQDMAVELP